MGNIPWRQGRQGEAAGPCKAPRVLLESPKFLLEQPPSSGVCTKGNPSLHPRGFCVAGNPTGGFPRELNPRLILEDFCPTDNPKMRPQGLHQSRSWCSSSGIFTTTTPVIHPQGSAPWLTLVFILRDLQLTNPSLQQHSQCSGGADSTVYPRALPQVFASQLIPRAEVHPGQPLPMLVFGTGTGIPLIWPSCACCRDPLAQSDIPKTFPASLQVQTAHSETS